MGKYNFDSIEDLREAVKWISTFVDDAIFGRLFELNSSGDSNLFFGDIDRIYQLAEVVEPALRESFPRLFHSGPDFDEIVLGAVMDLRRAFMTLGIFLGARIADPSGNAFAKLSEAWINATLAQPRYQQLAEEAASDE